MTDTPCIEVSSAIRAHVPKMSMDVLSLTVTSPSNIVHIVCSRSVMFHIHVIVFIPPRCGGMKSTSK